MIRVKTKYPIAVDSDDHKYPEGVYYDNNVSHEFVNQVESRYSGEINFMDLGCAGGALAAVMHDRGHKSVGIDGSDGCLNVRPDVIEHFGRVPFGHDNWARLTEIALFTADVTKEFDVLEDGELLKFDLITSWDVIEHFEPDTIDTFLKQVDKHLKDDGMFVGSIATFPSGTNIQWDDAPVMQYHKSLFPREWWNTEFSKQFNMINYPFSICNRDFINPRNEDPGYFVFCATKK